MVSVLNTKSPAATATLYGFIDWNNDGDFLDANETSTASVPSGTNGNISLTFSVPSDAVTGVNIGARIRLSTQAGLTAVGCAPDGEVEDYLVQICTPPSVSGASRCGTGTVTLTASGCSGGTLNWYAAASGGTSLGTGTSFTTPSLSATTTYYVDCTLSNCTSTRVAVTATINPVPSAPTATSPGLCGIGNQIILSATGCITGTLNWYAVASGGTSIGTGATFQTPNLSSTTTYYVDCTEGTCTSSRTPVTVSVYPIPNLPTVTDVSRCGAGTVTLNVSGDAGNTFLWYAAARVRTVIATTPSYTTPSLSTTTTYYVSSYNGNCASMRLPISAIINEEPTISASTTNPYCLGQTINLSANASVAGTFAWTGPNGFSSASQNPTIANMTGAMSGTYTVTQTATNGCTASATATVTLNCPSVTCTDNLLVNPSFETGNLTGWSLYSGSGQYGFVSVAKGYNMDGTYSATIASNSPEPPAGQPNILLQELPTIPGNIYNLSFYGGVHDPSKYFLAAVTFWNATTSTYISSSSGVQIDHIVDGSPLPLMQYSINNIVVPAGANLMKVEFHTIGDAPIVDAVCLRLICSNLTTAGFIGSDQNACGSSYDPAIITETTAPSGGSGTFEYQWQISSDNISWTDISGATSQSYDPPSISATRYYRRATRRGGCSNYLYTNVITITLAPPLSISAQPVNIDECIGGVLSLNVTATGGAPSLTYQWQTSTSSGGTYSNITGATAAAYTPPSVLAGINYYRVVISASGNACSNITSTPATVNVTTDPTPSISLPSASICIGGATSMTASISGGVSCSMQWQMSANNGVTWNDILGATNSTYTTSTLSAETRYRVRLVCAGNGCCN